MGRIFKRNGSWYIDCRSQGKRVKRKIGTKVDAQAALRAVESRIARGEYELIDNKVKFDNLAKAYMKAYRLRVRASTYESAQYPLNQLRKDFSERMVNTITLMDVDAYRERRLVQDGRSRRTANIEVGLLRRILTFGVERKLIASSPLAGVKALKEGSKRFRRALKPEEVQKLLAFATDGMRPVLVAFLKTGMRKSELVELRWSDVDLEKGMIYVQPKDAEDGKWETKTGDIRMIPIAQDLLVVLKKLRLAARRGAEHVFVTERGTPRRNNLLRQLRGTARRAGIDTRGLDLHALRYTWVTELLRRGVAPQVVQSLAGHKSLQVTMEIYAQVFQKDRKAAIDKLTYDDDEGARPQMGPEDEGLSQGVVG